MFFYVIEKHIKKIKGKKRKKLIHQSAGDNVPKIEKSC